MKRSLILKVAFISMITFTIVGGYFWYIYFDEREGKMLSDNVKLDIINNEPVTYINAIPNDEEENIPIYYFRVKNNLSKDVNYTLLFNEIAPNEINDGCNSETFFTKDELLYVLTLDNKRIKTGKLSNIKDNILDVNKVLGNSTNNYSLKVFLSPDASNVLKKHYHYSVDLKEQNEKNS